jgi:hypothetical protein
LNDKDIRRKILMEGLRDRVMSKLVLRGENRVLRGRRRKLGNTRCDLCVVHVYGLPKLRNIRYINDKR